MQPVKGLLVHTFGLEPFLFAQAFFELLNLAVRPVQVGFQLGPILESIAVPAEKELAAQSQDSHTPAAARTQKPRTFAAVIAARPVKTHSFPHILGFAVTGEAIAEN